MDKKPQDFVIDEDMEVVPQAASRELTCPICLDILDRTMATRECLHRFCSACISKALRSGNKECPTCRKKLSSRRCLRPNPNLDQLIAKLFNGEREPPQDSSRVVIVPECEIILRPLNGQRPRFIKCPQKTTIDHLAKYLSIRPEGTRVANAENNVEFRLCIVTDRSEGHYKMLEGKTTLDDIRKTFKLPSDKPLELYFYTNPSPGETG